jgi:hypothetical protein
MKLLTFINLAQKLVRTNRLFIRARHYGLNPIGEVKVIKVIKDVHDGTDLEHYGEYRYAHSLDKPANVEEGYELIFREPK